MYSTSLSFTCVIVGLRLHVPDFASGSCGFFFRSLAAGYVGSVMEFFGCLGFFGPWPSSTGSIFFFQGFFLAVSCCSFQHWDCIKLRSFPPFSFWEDSEVTHEYADVDEETAQVPDNVVWSGLSRLETIESGMVFVGSCDVVGDVSVGAIDLCAGRRCTVYFLRRQRCEHGCRLDNVVHANFMSLCRLQRHYLSALSLL